jgi:hypothetical protein
MTNITNYLRWAARGAVTSVFFWLETVFMLGLVSMAAGCPVWQWMVIPAGVGILVYLAVYAVRSHYQLYLVEQQRVMERLGGNGRS